MSESANCIFCKIARGEIPAIKVYENDLTVAFMDIQPASPGHTLIISKAHASHLLDIAEADLLAATATTQRVARAVQQSLAPDGIRISQFNGAAAGQTVFHYHIHIIPVWEGQKTGAHGRAPGDLEAMKQQAAQIQNALSTLS